jgi:hypothetical protein
MANFKRKKPRTRVRAKIRSMSSWPKWWDVIFHTRPTRRKNDQVMRNIIQGFDPDNAVFRDHPHKPHQYYW